MAEREQLRAVFQALDADARVPRHRIAGRGEHFSSGGEIRGFLNASPEHVSRLAWNIAAPARSLCRGSIASLPARMPAAGRDRSPSPSRPQWSNGASP